MIIRPPRKHRSKSVRIGNDFSNNYKLACKVVKSYLRGHNQKITGDRIENLNIHLFENPEDLKILCRNCHKEVHGITE